MDPRVYSRIDGCAEINAENFLEIMFTLAVGMREGISATSSRYYANGKRISTMYIATIGSKLRMDFLGKHFYGGFTNMCRVGALDPFN